MTKGQTIEIRTGEGLRLNWIQLFSDWWSDWFPIILILIIFIIAMVFHAEVFGPNVDLPNPPRAPVSFNLQNFETADIYKLDPFSAAAFQWLRSEQNLNMVVCGYMYTNFSDKAKIWIHRVRSQKFHRNFFSHLHVSRFDVWSSVLGNSQQK